ncbi:MAG: NAD(P)H-hydrate dehydratase [Clostridia bacterium]|nr:NAD(P)H-hydrate dehydratase [Clostridia bacterium]
MKILNAEQIREVENLANDMGMDFLRLMENAGSACARFIFKNEDANLNPKSKITIVCGKGKNGGDGFVIARKLFENGLNVCVVLASGTPKAPDAVENFTRVKKLNIPVYRLDTEYVVACKKIEDSDILVDCIFGIGFYGQPTQKIADVFSMISNSKATVYAIDVPSGVSTDTGEVFGECVQADYTIAISTLKPAHALQPSSGYCKKTVIVQIGIPDECYDMVSNTCFTADVSDINKLFSPRNPCANKGDFGKVISICGSYTMPGAACFAANSAVRSGAGLVTAAFPEKAYSAIAPHLTEPLLMPLDTNKLGTFSKSATPMLLNAIKNATAVVIGCGLGVNDDTKYIVNEIIINAKCPVIIDADGINAVCDNIDILKAAKEQIILTPHPGEMARLCNVTVQEVQNDRLGIAKSFSQNYGVTVVLKGAGTVVASPDFSGAYINRTGNVGMACGGSGDVLSGIMGGLVAQGLEPGSAAVAAVFIQGLAGDESARKLSKRGMTPTDMINELPLLLSNFE